MYTEPLCPQPWLAPHLKAEEEVLWTDNPDPRKVVNTRDIIFIPFALAVGIPLTIILPGTFAYNLAAGLAWAAAIIYVLVFRYYLRYREKKRTKYILTSQRILIMLQTGDEAVIKESLPFASIVTMNHNQVSDELGTVVFEPVMPARKPIARDKYGMGLQNPLFSSDILAFFDIKNSREVFDTIYQIRFRNYRQILGDWDAKPRLPV